MAACAPVSGLPPLAWTPPACHPACLAQISSPLSETPGHLAWCLPWCVSACLVAGWVQPTTIALCADHSLLPWVWLPLPLLVLGQQLPRANCSWDSMSHPAPWHISMSPGGWWVCSLAHPTQYINS